MANPFLDQALSNVNNIPTEENPFTNQVFNNIASLNKTEDKMQKLALPSAIKELSINGSAGSSFIGGTSHYNNQDVLDFLNTDDVSLETAYGKDAVNSKYKILNDINRENTIYNQDTSALDKAGTFGTGIGQGIVNSVGGIIGFGAGLVDADAGSAISKGTTSIADAIGSLRSNKSQNVLNTSNEIMALQSEDADREYQEDLNNGDDWALLRRIGKGVSIAVNQIASNGTSASDLVGQGVGSLVPTVAAAIATGGSSTVPTLASRLAVAGTAAAMGAGEGYTNTQQEIQGMDHESLMNGSMDYASLINEGYSQEQAKNIIANKAGLLAGTLSAPVNALGGGITHEFLSAPLTVAKKATGKGLLAGTKSAIGTTLKEGAEEFVQGGTTQVASNIGIKEFANKDKNIFQDVGEQATLEGLGGIGTAGLGQSIGIARNLTKKGITKVVDVTTPQAIKDKNKFIKTTADINDALNNINNIVSEENVSNNVNTANDTNISSNENENKSINTLSEKDNNIINILKENEIVSKDTNPKTSIELISLYNSLLDNPAFDDADRIMLTDRIKDQFNTIEQFGNLSDEEIEKHGSNADIYFNLRKYSKEFQENPYYKNAKENLNNLVNNSIQELSSKDIDLSNQSEDTINTLVDEIKNNPEIINETLVNNLNTAGIDTSEYQNIVSENKTIDTIKEDLGKELKLTNKDTNDVIQKFNDDFSNYVSKDIQIRGNSKNGGKSLLQFKNKINSEGITKSVKSRNNNQLNKFASHLANKLNAMDVSQDTTKQDIPYDFLTKQGKFYSELLNEGNKIKPNSIYFNLNANKTKLAYGSIVIDYLLTKKTIDEINQKHPDLKYTGINIEPNLKYINEISGLMDKIKSAGLEKYLPKINEKNTVNENSNNNNAINTDTTAVNNEQPVVEKSINKPYEVSSKGDKRFSAFYAKISPKMSIEEAYQTYVKGYNSIKEGKGKPPLRNISKEALKESYKTLWGIWANTHKEDMDFLREKLKEHKALSDTFTKKGSVNQAEALTDLLNENPNGDFSKYTRAYLQKIIKENGNNNTQLPLDLNNSVNIINNNDKIENKTKENKQLFSDFDKNIDNKVDVAKKIEENILEKSINNTYGSDKIKSYFKLNKRATNSIVYSEEPITISTLKNKILKDFPKISKNNLDSLLNLYRNIPELFKSLDKYSNKLLTISKDNIPNSERFISNPELMDNTTYIPAMFIDKSTGKYITPVKRATALGLFNTAINTNFIAYPDDLNNYDLNKLTKEEINVLHNSLTESKLVRTLAKNIDKELQLNSLNNTPIKVKQDLTKVLATQILSQTNKLFFRIVPIKNNEGNTINHYLLNDKFIDRYLNNDLTKGNNISGIYPLISQKLSNIESSSNFSLEPIEGKYFNDTVTNLPLTQKQKNIIDRQNNTKFKFNHKLINLFSKISNKNLHFIFGFETLPQKDGLNTKFIESVVGKNQSITTGFNKFKQIISTIPDDIKNPSVYFLSKIISSGRAMFEGINPQNNKFLRHLLLPTEASYDLNNDTHKNNFLRAVAQGLGAKIQKISTGDEQKAIDSILAKSPELMEILDVLSNDNANGEELFNALNKVKNVTDEISHMIHTLLEYSEYLKAIKNDEKFFTSNLFIELDGMANGAALNLLNFSPEDITNPRVKALYNAVGVYFEGDPYQSTQEYFAAGGKDIYELMASEANNSLKIRNEKFDPSLVKLLTNANIMEFNEGLPVFSRNLFKSPTMTFNYLAGKNAMANALLFNELAPKIYRAIAEVQMGKYNNVLEHPLFLGLTENDLKKFFRKNSKEMLDTSFEVEKSDTSNRNLDNYHLANYIKNMLISPAYTSLENNLLQSRNIIEIAANVSKLQQNLIYLISKDNLEKKGKPLQDLSEKEIKNTIKDTIKSFGLIKGNNGAIDIAETVFDALEDTSVSFKDLLTNKNYTTYYDIPTLSEEKLNSVGMGAMYNINNADVGIMLNTFSDPEFNKISGLMQVYDGININPLEMDNISKLLNKSVYTVMQENNVLPLIEAIDSLLNNNDLKKSNIISKDESDYKFLIKTKTELNRLNYTIQQRKDIISGVEMNIHQMVGSSEGYKHIPEKSKISLENSSNNQKEIFGKNNTIKGILTKLNPIISSNNRYLGTINYNQLINHFINNKLINKDILRVIKKIDKSNKIYSDLQIYFGTSKELNDFINSKKILQNLEEVSVKDGAYDPSDNSIYLPIENISYENIAHELIHAALSHKINDYYNNLDNQSYTDKLAIQNLEKIFQEFVDTSFSNIENIDSSVIDKLNQINNIPNNANKLNEFIAYTLSDVGIKAVAKATKVNNPLVKITKKVIAAIKKILGLDTFAPANNIFDNVVFNTNILLNSKNVNYSSQGDVLNVSNTTNLQNKFGRLFANIDDMSKRISSYVDAAIVDKDLINSGFNMSPEQSNLFKTIYAVTDASLYLNSRNRIEAEELMDHVLANIDENTFNNNNQYDFILNKNNSIGKPVNMFAKLIALSQTNDEFKQILSKLPLPKNENKVNSFDGLVDYLSNKLLSSMDNVLAGQPYSKKNGHNVNNALEILSKNLGKIEEPSAFDTVSNVFSGVNELVNEKSAGLVESMANGIFEHYENNFTKLGTTARLLSSAFSKKYGEIGADSITNYFNKNNAIPKAIGELFTEMRGTTQYTKDIIRVIKKSKGLIAHIRQQYKEKYPQEIKSIFGKDVTEKEYTSLFKTVGNTGLHIFDNAEISNILNNLNNELNNYKNKLPKDVLTEADNLANYLSGNKFKSETLHRNAYSIANAFNVPNLENTIDKYTTLKALSLNKSEDLDTLKKLYSSKVEGIHTLLNLLRDMQKNELANTNNKFAGYKGYLPKSKRNTKQVIVVPLSKVDELIRLGYTQLGKVANMRYAYMYSPVGQNESIQQGALQFVQSTYSGANQLNGISRGDMFSNYLTAREVASMGLSDKGKANLIPVRDKKGIIKGYEFYIPEQYALPDEGNRNTNIADAIGEYFGRKYEELFGHESNNASIEILYDLYKNDIDKSQYINVVTSTDKTVKDMWNTMPRELKIKIENKFGKNQFFIRKDMINNAIGYRNFSIGDIFNNENNNLNPHFKRIIVDFVKTVFGNKAYTYMVQAERILKSAVATAKDIIVIRSIVVPVANMISNVLQLQLQGVPILQIIKGLNSKFKEVRHYTENNDKILKLQFMQKNETDPIKLKNISARIELLKKSNRALTIWPLISAGELSTITDDLKLEHDSIMQGKWIENIQNKIVDNTPKSLQNAMKQALMTKDTSIYKIMFAGTQYGDFLAKAVFYDHLTKNKGVSAENAMMQITDEFINYDSNAGRFRSYLDSMGATWFMNYKIRSMKIAHKMLRDRPLSAIMATLGYIPSIPYINIGNPMSDNLWAKAYDGGLWYSIGPKQGLNAPSLLPVAGLF